MKVITLLLLATALHLHAQADAVSAGALGAISASQNATTIAPLLNATTGGAVLAQSTKTVQVIPMFTNCVFMGETNNQPEYQDASETYRCDQGDVTLRGKWGMNVEDAIRYKFTMGRLSPETKPATTFDRDYFKWCRNGTRVVSLCGQVPNAPKFDGDVPGAVARDRRWNPDPAKFPPMPWGLKILTEDYRKELTK